MMTDFNKNHATEMVYNRTIYNAEPNILLRLGITEALKKQHSCGFLTFSCAANWIDYAIKYQNCAIGDILEAVFAQLPYPIPKYYDNQLIDKKSRPLNDSLWVSPVDGKDYCYLRYMPTILMPTICFYGIDFENYCRDNKDELFIDFHLYAHAMNHHIYMDKYNNLDLNKYSVMIINDLTRFIDDITNGIITAITMSSKLTNSGFSQPYSNKNCMVSGGINYYKYNYDQPFFDNTCNIHPLFCKHRRLAWQNEFRIAINNVRFKQIYDRKNYSFEKNTLNVYLPHLREYSEIISMQDCRGIMFQGYDKKRFRLIKHIIKRFD